MTLPTYDEIMLPLLEIMKDKKEHSLSEIADLIAIKFNVTEEQRKELLPSGKYPIFRSRVSWAKTYLSKAKLIETTKRAHYKITTRGTNILKQNYKKLNNKTLSQFKEFNKFYIGSKKQGSTSEIESETSQKSSELTPQENLESAYKIINDQLAQDLLETVQTNPPDFFEKLVIDLLIKMGYGGSRVDAGKAIGKSNDGGIDGVINEDKLGLDTIYIQAKRWKNTVPVKEIRDFAGALLSKKSKKGIFITTSRFPKSAVTYVESIEPKIKLIDGKMLTKLMIENNVGVQIDESYEIKRIDNDYFNDDIGFTN